MIAAKCTLRRHRIRGWLIVLGVLLPGLAGGQTVQVPTLSLEGARTVLHAAEEKAQQRQTKRHEPDPPPLPRSLPPRVTIMLASPL